MAEIGTQEKPRLTDAGASAPFQTPPESPGPVRALQLSCEPEENEIKVHWEPPLDDGGAAVDEYEVVVRSPPPPPTGLGARVERGAPGRDGLPAPLADLLGLGLDDVLSETCGDVATQPNSDADTDTGNHAAGGGPAGDAAEEPAAAAGDAATECADDAATQPGSDAAPEAAEAAAEPGEPNLAAAKGPERRFRREACSFELGGLPPGSGPYLVEVRALSLASLEGPFCSLEASTAVAVPSVPKGLRARLLPGKKQGGGDPRRASSLARRGCGDTADSLRPHGGDVDIVHLEFRAPAEDGGRPIQSYTVYAAEETFEDEPESPAAGMSKLPASPSGSAGAEPEPIATCGAQEAAVGGSLVPGGVCACDVAVEPNRAYTFYVEAHNGVLPSGISEASGSVFVPARVPRPPLGPPEVFRVEGGFAAELRWVGPLRGGGLPLLSFKVGVLGPGGFGEAGGEAPCGDVAREATVSRAAAISAANDSSSAVQWQPTTPISEHEAVYATRVDGLHADAKYCFVLAASNAMGTGRWSSPSSPMTTPLAAPAMPANAVATVTVDDKQRVVVTVNWESGREQRGSSGAISAFHVVLVAQSAGGSASSSCAAEAVCRDRVPAPAPLQGQKMSWATPLAAPGSYNVEVSAESASGQLGPPAVLTLDVRPEAFPPPEPEAGSQGRPQWAEESVLVLGPAISAEDTRFGEFEETGGWLQALLLWHDADPGGKPLEKPSGVQRLSSGRLDSSIDVICRYRRPGSNLAHIAVLAAGITSSRLQVALPANVPMSLRLVLRTEPVDLTVAVKPSKQLPQLQSDPLLLTMSDSGEQLRHIWEVWARNPVGGGAPRWDALPDAQSDVLEAAWLEGGNMSKAQFELPERTNTEPGTRCLFAAGHYEVTFGDERQVQHSVRRLGAGGWSAKARRVVKDPSGEDAQAALSAEDQCVICMESRRTHAFMHPDTGDGHLAVCATCAEAYRHGAGGQSASARRTCPMCRRPFSALNRIYQ